MPRPHSRWVAELRFASLLRKQVSGYACMVHLENPELGTGGRDSRFSSPLVGPFCPWLTSVILGWRARDGEGVGGTEARRTWRVGLACLGAHPTAWLWATATHALRSESGKPRCYSREELHNALSTQKKSAMHICLVQVVLEKVRALGESHNWAEVDLKGKKKPGWAESGSPRQQWAPGNLDKSWAGQCTSYFPQTWNRGYNQFYFKSKGLNDLEERYTCIHV